jgi:hypothetical protein
MLSLSLSDSKPNPPKKGRKGPAKSLFGENHSIEQSLPALQTVVGYLGLIRSPGLGILTKDVG